jgi:KDO2-lipid IV(A) lauroyltransferase
MSLLLSLFSRLPLPVLYGFGYVVYLLVYRVFGVRKGVVMENLKNSFPEKEPAEIEALARDFYRNYCDVLAEMIKSITMGREDLLARVRFDGMDLLEETLARGQPVLLTLAHYGNVEWLLLALCCRLGYPTEVVYRPVTSAWVEKVTTAAYTRFGGTLIDDRSVVREIMQRRTVPRVVAIVSDQSPNIDDHSVWVSFLNQETAFYLAPDTIARFANYPVFFLGMRRLSRGHYAADLRCVAEPPYAGREQVVVKAYIDRVEKQILEDPADWLWMHKRWKRKKPVYT